MNAAYSHCSLFLCPEQHDYVSKNPDNFISTLQEIALISRKINPQEDTARFFTGDKLLNYIAYMGCAPAIKFEPEKVNGSEGTEGDSTFCFIKIHHYTSAELIYSKTQLKPPQCPGCRKPVKNWQQKLGDSVITCEQCNTTAGIEQFNWRKMAGYACLFIEITDIFPREAIPQQALLNALAKTTGTDWHYFYSCQ